MAITPTGTLTKKTHCQESRLVSTPPSSRPTAPPPTAIALQTPSAVVRSRPSANVVVSTESAAGRDERAAEALEGAAGHEDPSRTREPVHQRGGGEQHDPEDEQAPATEQVGGAAAEHEEATEREGVRVDDPLQARRREVQAALNRRQRDVHDGGVEDDHELGDARRSRGRARG